MGLRRSRVLSEVTRFMAVGGAATTVAFLLFNFLVHGFWVVKDAWLGDHPMTGYIIANTIGMWISYNGTKSWAFKHRQSAHPDGGVSAYVVINVITMTLPMACLWFSRHALGLTDPVADNIAANVVGLTMGTVARFFLFRKLVFALPSYQQTTLAGTVTDPLPLIGSEQEPTAPSTGDLGRPAGA
ncbi:GtrA family protein [Nocardioides daejeonensis]|uniref:GtrA family protein n=1 Tax=Nocardioides daejeonensis TaxID=1046556 RepID=UPI0013A58167|nr:GtrA family protein [Nocardioides daejeonensis]